ncbi:MAG TPA: bifunctional UDP-N-acetylmuramoyl-tripeptide:D-alanyl-D-alanine ligase/alanine racemase, partial [Prolixibacteraceae bacterium]|nr:bifunctional UDP-N-acetylmuramoyl-tripeptide:D-alanyl-D-alanine ligase/alanine racemase [Prolixibacteraceae bacterium]
MNYTLPEIADIIDGKLIQPPGLVHSEIKTVITDSRTFSGGENAIFFSIQGPRNNGHNYIKELIAKNIRAFVISEEGATEPGAAFILVANTQKALQKLATFHRKKFWDPVITITGSNGKTIVKEWLYELLSGEFKITRSPRSFNSQIGVPLSVLLMDNVYNLAIIEAGISQPGEMQNLVDIIRPDIGLLTNIGDAHQENFVSHEQKTKEKLQLFKSAKQLVYCADDPLVKKLAGEFCTAHSIRKVSWSLQGNEGFIQFRAQIGNNKTAITATTKTGNDNFEIPFTNHSAIENACHCFAASVILKPDKFEFLHRFSLLEPIAMRLEIKKGINNSLLINDYYNSDFTSLTMALTVLHQQAKKGFPKKMVILSDIQQTGIPPDELYKRVNHLLLEWNIDEITGIGPEICANAKQFSIPGKFYTALSDFEKDFNREKFRDSAILIKGARKFTFEKLSALLQRKANQTVLEINLNALVNNLNIFKSRLNSGTKIMVMVKAFSYGSGDTEIAKLLQFQHVDYLAVAVADEGVELRNAGIQTPIIVMNPELHSFQHLIDYRLEPNIYSVELLQDFIKSTSQNALQNFPIHLKLDTGMNRLGLKTEKELEKVISILQSEKSLKIKSVFSHLAASDEKAFDEFTNAQFSRFESAFKKIASQFNYKIDRHILNSAGIERFPEKQFEMVRLGIGLYGVSVTGLPLENISTLKSTISQVKTVRPDETIGYGRKGEVNKLSKIAVVPLGYADGLDRKLSDSNGSAIVKGKKASIIGN